MKYCRECLVNDKKGVFHKWVTNSKIVFKAVKKFKNEQDNVDSTIALRDVYLNNGVIPSNVEFGTISNTYGLVEFEDGTIEEVEPKDIKFTDNSIELSINIEEEDARKYFEINDKKGNILYSKSIKPFRYGKNYTYDDNGNCISCNKEDGTWWIERYDSQNRPIYYEDNYGNKRYIEYDDNGNITHSKSVNKNNISEFWVEYDKKGRMIKRTNNEGHVLEIEYLPDGTVKTTLIKKEK